MSRPRYWLAGTLVACCLAVSVNAQVANQVVNSIIATTCTNQLIRSIAATGAGTCASIATADITANAVTNAKLATMTTSTIKGQIVGGSGDPVDMTATQAAAVIGSVGGTLKSKQLAYTRDLTVATGSVAYTGMGFQPTSCIGSGQVAGGGFTNYTSLGSIADSSRSPSTTYYATTAKFSNSFFFAFADATETNYQLASIASYDADGFTLSWTKTGTPTGTASFTLTCFR